MTFNARAIAHLEAGGCLLTPGLRQARIFRRLHDRSQIAAGRRVWPSAQVLPLDVWLLELWRDAGAARAELPEPLPVSALRWLWRRQAAGDTSGLIDPAALGARARMSWLGLRAHGGMVEDVARFPLTRDQQAFVSWARGAERELLERHACDAMDLPRLFVELDAIPPPGAPLLLAGFRRLAPAEAALCDALRQRGWSVERLAPQPEGNVLRKHAARDPDGERVAMLGWIRGELDRCPEGLHGIILPDLDLCRGSLRRSLEATLQPEHELGGSALGARVFDLAGGEPLATQPVVESAVDAMACALGALDWPRASRLLRSPYFAGAAGERGARIRLDVASRSTTGVSAPSIGSLVARAEAGGAGQFALLLKGSATAVAGSRLRRAGAWAEVLGACLSAWGWPGETPLSSREFQAARHFRAVLDELASLGSVAPEFDAPQALDEVRRLAAAPFQPESGEPAVFVLDAYDDPGVRFDSLWVAGLTAAAWPRAVAVDPLLPIEVQRRLALPRVTAEASVTEAREIIECWRAASAELVLSWPCREHDTDVDGTPLVPAGALELAVPPSAPTRDRLAHGASRLQPVPDGELPFVQGAAHGGARLIELQSLCPFRAFAELRLHSEPLEEPQGGVDRRVRGIALHRALQSLWRELGSQASLRALTREARDGRILSAVERALAEALPAGCGARTLALEREWQRRAIDGFLEMELRRPSFTVIETERSLIGRIGGLELKLRVDRVDQVGPAIVVIDYKSGRTRKAPWRGARMEAPQLPLYAVLHPSRPAAIAIAELDAAGAAYRGVAREEGIIDGLQPATEFELTELGETGFSWERVRERWYAWLDRLARDHARGRTDVDPKLGAETCRTCHLAALCRVAAVQPDDAGSEGATDAG